jgi:uncharacterized membrane protein
MTRSIRILALVALLAALAAPASAQTAVVRSVLFYSPTCGHCHEVINNRLPGIFEQFGGAPDVAYDDSLSPEDLAFYEVSNGTVQMLFVDVSVEAGAELYAAATADFEIPEDLRGVPRLVVGDDYYVGSVSIPDEFPGIIEEGLAAGGIDWPAIEGIESALAAVPGLGGGGQGPSTTTTAPTTTTTTEPSEETAPTPADILDGSGDGSDTEDGGQSVFPTGSNDSVWEKFTRDAVANTVAVAVLLGMIASVAAVALMWRRAEIRGGPDWLIPVLALVGVGVAAYLAYVETSGSEAVCGPVGNCNAVQESKYAELFGLIPVGIVGLVGYAVVIGAWLVIRVGRVPLADWARLALFGGAAVGVVFSIYLTFLEPFVIGASCAWCLASAIIVTLLFWLTVGPAQEAWRRLRAGAALSS